MTMYPESRGTTRREFLTRAAALTSAAAVPGAGLLSGCGSGSGSEAGPLEFWQFYGPGGTVPAQSQWFSKAVQQWNGENETKIRLRYITSDDYLNGSTLVTAFQSGDGPDLFIISPGDFLRYHAGGVLQDLTPFISQEAQQDFFPDAMATRIVDNRIYAIPMEVEPMAMFYSVRAFESAGLSEGDIPQTWDQLLDVADKLRNEQRFGVLFDTNPGYYQNFTWYPFMWMGGADAVAETGGSGFDSRGAVQALQFWQDAIDSGVAPRKALGTGANDIVANLSQGYCAIQNCGIWGVAAMEANAPDFEYDVFRLPVPPGGSYSTDLGGWAFVANSQGKNPEEAAKFCAWALASMDEDSIARGVDWITHADSTLSPRKSVQQKAEQDGAFESGVLKTFRDDIFPGGRGEPRYPPEIYEAISDAIQACQLTGAAPAAEAESAAQAIGTFLKSYSGAKIV